MEPIQIKRYPNRRLYTSREGGKYITLNDVRDLIDQGNEIQVITTDKKHDITHKVLLDILIRREEKTPTLSFNTLYELIRSRG